MGNALPMRQSRLFCVKITTFKFEYIDTTAPMASLFFSLFNCMDSVSISDTNLNQCIKDWNSKSTRTICLIHTLVETTTMENTGYQTLGNMKKLQSLAGSLLRRNEFSRNGIHGAPQLSTRDPDSKRFSTVESQYCSQQIRHSVFVN